MEKILIVMLETRDFKSCEVHSIISKNITTTRAKDFYDLYTIREDE